MKHDIPTFRVIVLLIGCVLIIPIVWIAWIRKKREEFGDCVPKGKLNNHLWTDMVKRNEPRQWDQLR